MSIQDFIVTCQVFINGFLYTVVNLLLLRERLNSTDRLTLLEEVAFHVDLVSLGDRAAFVVVDADIAKRCHRHIVIHSAR